MLGSIYGIPVRVIPDTPRFQLSADCPVSEDYRADTDAWAREWCGVHNLLADGQVMQHIQNEQTAALFMNPRTAEKLKREAA